VRLAAPRPSAPERARVECIDDRVLPDGDVSFVFRDADENGTKDIPGWTNVVGLVGIGLFAFAAIFRIAGLVGAQRSQRG